MSANSPVEFIFKKKLYQQSLFFHVIFLLFIVLIIASGLILSIDSKEKLLQWRFFDDEDVLLCQSQKKPYGSEALPRGIISAISDLERKSFFGHNEKNSKKPTNLLAMAVGIKQKKNVDKIVKKFLSSGNDFVMMFFHYDGIVDEWNDLEWSSNAIHYAAVNQTKCWFAKRFLHPDHIVANYEYIFFWDEDLGVDYFHPGRYLSIIKEEGLEISQPALDPRSEVHHPITRRQPELRVHRRLNRPIRRTRCDKNITGPPCSGFVEMMAPVFSKASWRCAWHMFQNDLVHGWGVDFQLGYCANGDPNNNVGVVDSEYIIHYGLPTLGGSATNKTGKSSPPSKDRQKIRQQSFTELDIFNERWRNATENDENWIDIYKQ